MADLASRRSIHKAPDALGGKQSGSYWIALPTCENTLLAFDQIRRIVPTTITRITANITAYSAMSCPCSSFQSCCNSFATGLLFLGKSDLLPTVERPLFRSTLVPQGCPFPKIIAARPPFANGPKV